MPLEIDKTEPNDDVHGEGDGAKSRGETDVRIGDIVTKEEVFNMSLFQKNNLNNKEINKAWICH